MDVRASSEGRGRSCVLVGEGTLVIECGELLRSGGLFIEGVLSGDASVARWAESIGAQFRSHGDDTTSWMRGIAPDYLFSIFNLVILPPAVIEAARIAAINYHDALLPRYAGLHATSWAIYNEERTHGITWHLMESGIDTGAILGQRTIDIAPIDTALSLNLKCFAAAVGALQDLLPDLLDGSLHADPQELSKRTYYAGSTRPPGDGTLNWSQPAERIDALVRACNFGPYLNPLALPKFWLASDCMVVSRSAVSGRPIETEAGVLLHIGEDALTVSTASGSLDVSGLMTVDGEPLSGFEAARRYGLEVGQRLPVLGVQDEDAVTCVAESLYRYEEYWERRLEALVPASPFRKNPGVPSGRNHVPTRQRWRIPEAVDAWVERHEHQWRREEFLLAACGAFLARLTFGETFDVELTRDADESTSHRAVFASAVPFRFEIDSDFFGILERVRAELESVERNRTYPRDLVPRSPRLRGQLHLRRETKLPVGIILGEPLVNAPHWDMAITVPAQSRHGVIDVDPALHDQLPGLADRLTRFVQQFADTDGALPLVSLASQSERDRLSEWGTGAAPAVSLTDCLHELFEAQVLRTPHAVAVRDGEEELTYRELNSAADALAAVLRRDGVGPDVGVGICVGRSPALIIGLLGILKAGGFYVPLDPTIPRKRLLFFIEDAKLQTIVTVRAHSAGLPSVRLVHLDEIDPEASGTPQSEIGSEARRRLASAAAYVMYTSGSTGEPKGVRVEHRSVVNFVQAARQEYHLTATDVVLQFASIGFDTSVEEIFPTLASGATLVLRPEDMLGSAKSFLGMCARLGITVLDLPTAYWHTLVPQLLHGAASLWPELRLVIIGGEAADSAAVQDWFAATSGSVDLINTYGPTEATVIATWARLTPGESGSGGAAIGSPLPGVSVEVLDRFGLPVPVGVIGELVIGGAGVASGYLYRPQLTSEKFQRRSDPTGHQTRMFHSGDLCCWRPDGMLEFVGRIDEQVKVRGHRVELREIELVLEAQTEIAHAAVVARANDQPGATVVLRACVVAHSADEGLDVARLRAAVGEQLPDWMIPGEWVLLDQLPLSANGKIDRRALSSDASPGPRLSATVRSGTVDEAATLLEQEVRDIWRKLFDQVSVRRDDNFFDLGGDSLLAVCFVEELERRLGHSVPINVLFEFPTIEALSQELAEQSWMPAWTSLVPLKPTGTRPPLFMVHGGGGQVFGYRNFALQLDPDQPVYGVQAVTDRDGTTIHVTMNDMADHYVREIRALQPEGPYFVGGYSLGGWFAYEVAARLRAAQAQVHLVLIDSYPCGSVPRRTSRAYAAMKLFNASVRADCHLRELKGLQTAAKVSYLADKAKTLVARKLSRSSSLANSPVPSIETDADDDAPIRGSDGVPRGYYEAVAARHLITPIDCAVDLIVSEDPRIPLPAKILFWRQLATGDLRIHRLRGVHLGMMGDERLARRVNQILTSRAASQSGSSTASRC